MKKSRKIWNKLHVGLNCNRKWKNTTTEKYRSPSAKGLSLPVSSFWHSSASYGNPIEVHAWYITKPSEL